MKNFVHTMRILKSERNPICRFDYPKFVTIYRIHVHPRQKCMCIKKILICTCIYNMCTCIYTHSLICVYMWLVVGQRWARNFSMNNFICLHRDLGVNRHLFTTDVIINDMQRIPSDGRPSICRILSIRLYKVYPIKRQQLKLCKQRQKYTKQTYKKLVQQKLRRN